MCWVCVRSLVRPCVTMDGKWHENIDARGTKPSQPNLKGKVVRCVCVFVWVEVGSLDSLKSSITFGGLEQRCPPPSQEYPFSMTRTRGCAIVPEQEAIAELAADRPRGKRIVGPGFLAQPPPGVSPH